MGSQRVRHDLARMLKSQKKRIVKISAEIKARNTKQKTI